jgi:hypothetical protein
VFGVYCLYYVSCLGFIVSTMYLYLYCFSVCAVSCLYYFDNGLLDLDAGRLARSQNPEGPATGHPDTGFLGFPGS